MRWHEPAARRVVCPAPSADERAAMRVQQAWALVVDARTACLRGQWERADLHIRTAICVATEALVGSHGWELPRGCEFESARRIGREYFGARLADPIFERVDALAEMLPLDPVLDGAAARGVKDGIKASSEYVALVEGFTYRP